MFWTFQSCKNCWTSPANEQLEIELEVRSEPSEELAAEAQPLASTCSSPASTPEDTFSRKAPVELPESPKEMPAATVQPTDNTAVNTRMQQSSRRQISRQTRSMSSLLSREASHYEMPTPFGPECFDDWDQEPWPAELPVLGPSRAVEVVGWDEMQRRLNRNRRREKSTLKRIFTKQAKV